MGCWIGTANLPEDGFQAVARGFLRVESEAEWSGLFVVEGEVDLPLARSPKFNIIGGEAQFIQPLSVAHLVTPRGLWKSYLHFRGAGPAPRLPEAGADKATLSALLSDADFILALDDVVQLDAFEIWASVVNGAGIHLGVAAPEPQAPTTREGLHRGIEERVEATCSHLLELLGTPEKMLSDDFRPNAARASLFTSFAETLEQAIGTIDGLLLELSHDNAADIKLQSDSRLVEFVVRPTCVRLVVEVRENAGRDHRRMLQWGREVLEGARKASWDARTIAALSVILQTWDMIRGPR